ncbi:MAG: outer membrane protein, partial [Xanthobacteraceae bacterium]
MTRIAFAIRIAAVALSIAPAAAADLGRFPPASRFYAPAPVLRVYNWTGCYLGGQLGGAWANNQLDGQLSTLVPVSLLSGPTIVDVVTPIADNAGSAAVTVGGQGGCDLQFARNWVIGAQLDGVWTHLSGSQGINGSAGLPQGGHIDLTANQSVHANAIATATGRLGFAVNYDDVAGLFYIKGGAAFVNYDTFKITGNNAATTCTAVNAQGVCLQFSSPSNTSFNFTAPSASRWGWTIGLGTEWVVDGNWSIFGEWDYMNFGSHTVNFTDSNSGT